MSYFDHRFPTVIARGRMRDVNVSYTVYSNYRVEIDGAGRLEFNLRDFDMLTAVDDISFHAVVKGNFNVVGYRAFFDWISLKSVQLPRTIRVIEEDAFSDCDNLEEIIMPGDIEQFSTHMFCYTQPKRVIFYDDCPTNMKLVEYFHSLDIDVLYRGAKSVTNVKIFEETREIYTRGTYHKDGREISLGFTPEEMREVTYIDLDMVEDLLAETAKVVTDAPCKYQVVNADSYAATRQMAAEVDGTVLVLNFANAIHPGGGVTRGSKAQEEDLCRKSSLFASLTSELAKPYYAYNLSIRDPKASDTMLVNPKVAIFRDDDYSFLNEPVHVAVLTSAAPIYNKRGHISDDAYVQMFYHRIQAMLHAANHYGYENLILGAWGCGAYGNDAKLVAELFAKALDEMSGAFRNVTFAILSRNPEGYNLRSFRHYFS